MRAPHTDAWALAALTLGAVLIGLAPIFVRLADVGPVACAFWRCALAWPLLALLSMRFESCAATNARTGLLAAGSFFAADLALWHYAISRTSVANATLLANVAPVFVTAAAWILFRERITRRFLIGLVLALAGAATLVGHSVQLSPASATGDALAVAAAAFYAGYLMSVEQLRRTQGTLTVMAWTSATVALVLLPLALALGEPVWPRSAQGWMILAGMALLSHVGGQGLIAYSLATLPVAFSSVGLLVQPLAAAIFAWILLGERFGLLQAAGAVVVLAGILVCRLDARGVQAREPSAGAP